MAGCEFALSRDLISTQMLRSFFEGQAQARMNSDYEEKALSNPIPRGQLTARSSGVPILTDK